MISTLRRVTMALVGACLLTAVAQAAGRLAQPLRVSADGHYLTEPDGSPFFWLADTAWDIFQRPSRQDVELYLTDRAAKGFTVIQAVVGGAAAHQGPNRYGHSPFMDDDPMRPDPAYFENVDWILQRATHHKLRMAVVPYWGGAFSSNFHIVGLPEKRRLTFTPDSAKAYGRWLGRRYRDYGITWLLGGDINPLWPKAIWITPLQNGSYALDRERSDFSIVDWRPVYDGFAEGLAEGQGGPSTIAYHPNCCTFPGAPKPLSSAFLNDRGWLTIHMLQSSHYENPPEQVHGFLGFSFGWIGPRNYEAVRHEYDAEPTRPVIDGEARFEDIGKDNDGENVTRKGYWNGYDARNAAYHAVFAGAAGHSYGNHAVWQFAEPGLTTIDPPIPAGVAWREALHRPAASQMQHLKALMLSRPYFTRVPDQSLIVGEAGDGTAHIGATRDAQGRYAMVYLPHGQPVTVDLSLLAGRVNAWWFDPRSGAATRIKGEFSPAGRQTFTPPSNGNEQDWVLVLDDARQKFAAPAQRP